MPADVLAADPGGAEALAADPGGAQYQAATDRAAAAPAEDGATGHAPAEDGAPAVEDEEVRGGKEERGEEEPAAGGRPCWPAAAQEGVGSLAAGTEEWWKPNLLIPC